MSILWPSIVIHPNLSAVVNDALEIIVCRRYSKRSVKQDNPQLASVVVYGKASVVVVVPAPVAALRTLECPNANIIFG
jgi:hypothetical protein